MTILVRQAQIVCSPPLSNLNFIILNYVVAYLNKVNVQRNNV